MKRLSDTSGSALIASFIVALLVAGIAGLYLESVRQEIKNTHRTRLLLEAVNIAEIGAEDALYALINSDWSGWTSGTEGYSRRITNLYGGLSNETRYIDVFVRTNIPDEPIIVAEAVLRHPVGIEVKRQLRIDLSRGGVFMNGLTARDQVQMNGNKINIDSYHSGSGVYNSTTNRNDKGSVASVSMGVAAVDLQNADVLGYVATGGAPPSVGKNGSVTGYDTPSGVKVDPNRVSTDFYAEFPPVEIPTLGCSITNPPTAHGSISLGAAEYHYSSFNVGSQQVFNITTDVVMIVDGNIDIKGEININYGGSLTLYASGDITISGNGFVNNATDSVPADLIIFGTAPEGSGQTIKLSGNGAMQAAVYAPYADVEMKGSGNSGTMMGAVIANNILLTGNFEFHYDEALKDYGDDTRFAMDGWRELDLAADRYSDVLALKDNF